MDNEHTQHQKSTTVDHDQDEPLHAEKLINHDGQLPESNNFEAEPVDTHRHGNVSVVEDTERKKRTSVPVWRLVSACH
jgi:hypothetical protein